MNEKIFFKNSKGDRLCGILSDPDPEKKEFIMIMFHGNTSSKDSRKNLELERLFNTKGIASFRADFYAHGESEGRYDELTISECVDDILNAVRFIKKMGYKKIGLFGSSLGGIASIIAASRTDDLILLAVSCPVSDYAEIIAIKFGKKGIEKWKKDGLINYKEKDGRKYFLKYSFFLDAQKNIVHDVADKINIPVLIVHGDKDKTVPFEQSIKTASLIKNCKLEKIKGADHYFEKERDFNKMIILISGFVFSIYMND